MKDKKFKTWRIEQIADAFLRHLSQDGVDGDDALLDKFLNNQKVYGNAQILQQVIDLLLERGFIKEIQQSSSFVGFFQTPPGAKPGAIVHPKDWLGDVELVLKQSEITAKGRDFVEKGQELDSIAVAERKANLAKWKERGITLLIALGTAIAVTLVTEPIKQHSKEREEKNAPSKSSPVRPRINPRQRPEPREPAGATAPRSGARR
jgi:predicted transcriptional regulator